MVTPGAAACYAEAGKHAIEAAFASNEGIGSFRTVVITPTMDERQLRYLAPYVASVLLSICSKR